MAKNKSPMKSTPTVQHKKKNKGSCKYSGFCPLTNPGDFKWEKGLEIVNADKISDKEFFNRFIKTRTPCIIRGPVSDLNPDVFSLESLGLLAQNADVVVEKRGGSVKNFGEGRKIQMKFDELVDKIEKGDTEHYMTTQPLPEDLLGYKELFAEPLCSIAGSFPTLPQFISQGVVPHQVNMWLGNTPKGTSSTSGLHHDFHDNVYLLISGKKTFRLFSPTMADQLGLVGNLKKVLPNGLIVYSNSESGPSTPADEVREDGAPMLEVMKWKARGRKCLRDGIEKMMKGDEQQKGEESGEEGEEIDLDELDLEEFEGMSSGEDEDEDASEGGRGGEAGRLSMPSDSEEEEEEEEEEGEELLPLTSRLVDVGVIDLQSQVIRSPPSARSKSQSLLGTMSPKDESQMTSPSPQVRCVSFDRPPSQLEQFNQIVLTSPLATPPRFEMGSDRPLSCKDVPPSSYLMSAPTSPVLQFDPFSHLRPPPLTPPASPAPINFSPSIAKSRLLKATTRILWSLRFVKAIRSLKAPPSSKDELIAISIEALSTTLHPFEVRRHFDLFLKLSAEGKVFDDVEHWAACVKKNC